MKLKIITHFYNDDPDCSGDYASVTVELEGMVIANYGDYYHDKGEEKAEGFIDGVRYMNNRHNEPTQVEYESVADATEDGSLFNSLEDV